MGYSQMRLNKAIEGYKQLSLVKDETRILKPTLTINSDLDIDEGSTIRSKGNNTPTPLLPAPHHKSLPRREKKFSKPQQSQTPNKVTDKCIFSNHIVFVQPKHVYFVCKVILIY